MRSTACFALSAMPETIQQVDQALAVDVRGAALQRSVCGHWWQRPKVFHRSCEASSLSHLNVCCGTHGQISPPAVLSDE